MIEIKKLFEKQHNIECCAVTSNNIESMKRYYDEDIKVGDWIYMYIIIYDNEELQTKMIASTKLEQLKDYTLIKDGLIPMFKNK